MNYEFEGKTNLNFQKSSDISDQEVQTSYSLFGTQNYQLQ
ncbi:hypothetical protein Mgra_00008319, partial [Meloidogyne graminicola]